MVRLIYEPQDVLQLKCGRLGDFKFELFREHFL